MTLCAFIFYMLAIVILTATVLAITRRQPIHAVLYLIVAFLSTAALFFLLGAPLLAVFMVIVYAGAIMVFILFVIMLFRSSQELGLLSDWGPATLLGIVFLAVAVAMVFKDPGGGMFLRGAVAQPKDFGRFLFDRYWMAIEIVSLLLLVALVAIIHLGKRGSEDATENEE